MQNPKKKKKINTEFCSKKKVKTQLFIFTLVSIFKIQNKKLKKKNTNSSLRFLFFFARNVWKYFHKTCNQTATSHLQIVRGKFIEIKISLSETKKKKTFSLAPSLLEKPFHFTQDSLNFNSASVKLVRLWKNRQAIFPSIFPNDESVLLTLEG